MRAMDGLDFLCEQRHLIIVVIPMAWRGILYDIYCDKQGEEDVLLLLNMTITVQDFIINYKVDKTF